jgi:exosortase A-associated hydrolase 2
MLIQQVDQHAHAFFMQAEPGRRFCIYHPSRLANKCLGSVLYVHPYAEEMNKSRRMVAEQARALAALGYNVLLMDLFGCGDSCGDFGDARWEIWKSDIAAAEKWLAEKSDTPLFLWGIRLGAILALEYAKEFSVKIRQIILWQPVVNTKSYLTQLFRLRLANDMLSADGKTQTSIQAIRETLLSGQTVEIAGYEQSPAMVNVIDKLLVDNLAVTNCPIHWFDILPASRINLTPAAQNLSTLWRQQGVDLTIHLVPGVAFWTTQEMTINVDLLKAMSHHFSTISA